MIDANWPIGWQPIETAPKSRIVDGRSLTAPLLGFIPDMAPPYDPDQGITVIWWEPSLRGGRGGWCTENREDDQPSHFMPLPKAPGPGTAKP